MLRIIEFGGKIVESVHAMTVSKWALVLANALPLLGAILFDWDVFLIIGFYWLESVIIGFYNLLKMLFLPMQTVAGHFSKAFTMVFFLVHYGGFCAGHGVFIYVFSSMLSDDHVALESVVDSLILVFSQSQFDSMVWLDALSTHAWIVLCCFGLMISHGVSMVQHYWLGHERHCLHIDDLMLAPYKRIVLMHVVLVIGAWPAVLFDSPAGMLAVLIMIKVIIDLDAHNKSHAGRRGRNVKTLEI